MLTFIGCPFHTRVLQWHVKDPLYSVKKCSRQVTLNTHTSSTQRSRCGLTVLSRHSVGTYQGNELTRNSSGSTRRQSSQLAEQLWTDLAQNVELVYTSYRHLCKRKGAGEEGIACPTPEILATVTNPPPYAWPCSPALFTSFLLNPR